MQIVLIGRDSIRITWPVYDAKTEAEIVRRIKTVPGIEGTGRRYSCSAIQTARLMELFPKASFDYRAMQAADATAQQFYGSMIVMGVELVFDESRGVYAVSENASPLIQQLLAERSHAIKDFVISAEKNPKPKAKAMASPVHGPLTAEDAGWDRVMTGARNAAKREEQVEQFKFQKRRRKVKKENVAL